MKSKHGQQQNYKKKPFKRTFKRKPKASTKFVTKAEVKRYVQGTREHKYFDTPFAVVTIPRAGNVLELTTIAQGLLDTNRIGDNIQPTSLQINLLFSNDLAAGVATWIRFVIFRWKIDTNIALPALGNIMQNTPASTLAPLSPFNHDQRSQFEVLYDDLFNLDNVYGSVNKCYKMLLPLAQKEVKYDAATTTASGHLYSIMISNVAAVLPTATGYIRVNYTDA